MLDNIFRFFLAFSHSTVILPLIIIGYIWLDRKVFFHGMCLLLISVLLNFALKVSFQVPLAPALGKEGFAFPSGHMHASIALYGWLFESVNQRLIKGFIIILLMGIGAGLLYFGYHTYEDILGAIFFSILLIFLYNWFLSRGGERFSFTVLIGVFSTLLLIYSSFLYEIKDHVWKAYYILISAIAAERYFRSNLIFLTNYQKAAATLFYIVISLFINRVFFLLVRDTFLFHYRWLLIGFFLPFSVYLAKLISFQKRGAQQASPKTDQRNRRPLSS